MLSMDRVTTSSEQGSGISQIYFTVQNFLYGEIIGFSYAETAGLRRPKLFQPMMSYHKLCNGCCI